MINQISSQSKQTLPNILELFYSGQGPIFHILQYCDLKTVSNCLRVSKLFHIIINGKRINKEGDEISIENYTPSFSPGIVWRNCLVNEFGFSKKELNKIKNPKQEVRGEFPIIIRNEEDLGKLNKDTKFIIVDVKSPCWDTSSKNYDLGEKIIKILEEKNIKLKKAHFCRSDTIWALTSEMKNSLIEFSVTKNLIGFEEYEPQGIFASLKTLYLTECHSIGDSFDKSSDRLSAEATEEIFSSIIPYFPNISNIYLELSEKNEIKTEEALIDEYLEEATDITLVDKKTNAKGNREITIKYEVQKCKEYKDLVIESSAEPLGKRELKITLYSEAVKESIQGPNNLSQYIFIPFDSYQQYEFFQFFK